VSFVQITLGLSGEWFGLGLESFCPDGGQLDGLGKPFGLNALMNESVGGLIKPQSPTARN